MTIVIIGVDPGLGPTTGMCLLPEPGTGTPLAFQCNAEAAFSLALFLLEASEGPANVVAAGEAFVPGTGAGARGASARVTRQVITDLDPLCGWHWRSAATVKPWARLRVKAAGLHDATESLPHARDAMMHVLYCAVHDCGWPDPLGKEGKDFWRTR